MKNIAPRAGYTIVYMDGNGKAVIQHYPIINRSTKVETKVMAITAEQIEHAKQLGWTVEKVHDTAPFEEPISYWCLVTPDGDYFATDYEDYGYGSGDSSPDEAWQHLPADLAKWRDT